jgi:hypothetical protein
MTLRCQFQVKGLNMTEQELTAIEFLLGSVSAGIDDTLRGEDIDVKDLDFMLRSIQTINEIRGNIQRMHHRLFGGEKLSSPTLSQHFESVHEKLDQHDKLIKEILRRIESDEK